MTTRYTELTENGITFEDFVMSSEEAFGALVTIQDDLTVKTKRIKDSPEGG